MAQRSRRRLVVLMVGVGLGCMVAALMLVAGRLGASSARAAGRSPVISFYFGLRRPESQAVAAFFAVERPGGRTYRRFSAPARSPAGTARARRRESRSPVRSGTSASPRGSTRPACSRA